MDRGTTSSIDTVLASDRVPMLVFIEMDFDEGALRVCNAGYDFNWNGYTWIGAGAVGKIQPIEEGAELQVYGVTFQLTGIPSAMISTALNYQYQGRTAKIWIALLNADDYSIISNPIGPFVYRIDVMNIELGPDAVITLTAQSRLADWDRPRVLRYTQEDQQSLFQGDMFFQYVPQMVDKTLIWGRQ